MVVSQLSGALTRSAAFAEAVRGGDLGKAVEVVAQEARPLVSSALQARQAAQQAQQAQAVVPLPLHNFPDVPVDNFDLPGFNMDPFGVDLMLSNNAAGLPTMYHQVEDQRMPSSSSDQRMMPSSAPQQPLSTSSPPLSAEGIRRQVQSEVNRLKVALLALEQKTCNLCMQKSWSLQRLPWRIKVKKATNFADLLGKLKELRKGMVPFTARNADLDQYLNRLSPTSINAHKLSRCLEDFKVCIAKNFPEHEAPPLRYELAKIAKAIDDTGRHGIEVFTKLPLSEIFAKHPDVASSLKVLLQKQKLEVVSKLAELNSEAHVVAGGGNSAMARPTVSLREDDEQATDMSDSD
ncbi:hypothetical protein HOP50_15g74330 [Chloropicon primus]|uniref:Uncharacterized protein n=1 Tax=Chloropicon primus TaxID=1764295 RepID=A0A5B8MZC2_9CHLO|nr:hypothetical protein A3770_15p74080 [Chloropicon primus]UPR04100.1 hypothetical protein HOP50_15g74330 [Chloropicon primus]|eukprot:QDZ24890.1 hypothetical protein A3770_15p74080 [Chloropicon primus]